MKSARAFAPASVANVAVGFDLLGFSASCSGDWITVEQIDSPTVEIAKISSLDDKIPEDPTRNTAGAGLLRLIKEHQLTFGFRVSIRKGIPLGSGMGGSSASAVGALVAANALLESPLSREELLPFAVIGEAVASGSMHADNVAPCLFGGLTLAKTISDGESMPRVEVLSLPVPKGIHCVLVHPHLRVDTRDARAVLMPEVSLKGHVRQSANLATFVSGCFLGDSALIGKSLEDSLIEPQRARLIPGFDSVKAAAMASGALGCSISGAGPAVFAWCLSEAQGHRIGTRMIEAFQKAGTTGDSWVFALPCEGAKVVK